MEKGIRKIGVLTSGGDAPGMNAAIRAVVRASVYHKLECIGIYRGYEGLIEEDFKNLNARSVKNIINRGGTLLKSARSKEFFLKEGRLKAYNNLKNEGIDALVTIGGDGTFAGASVFSNEFDIPIIGIPGTIDNDINGTDFTIGYDTALNTVVEAIDKIRDTANSHNRLFLVEVMGRDAGDIALNAGIGAGAEEILIPEQDMGRLRLIESLKKSKKSGKTSSIIVVSEGDQIGKNIFKLASYIEDNLTGYEVRVTVLGHIQRGGSPSCFDRVLASRLGVKAVDALIDNQKNMMIGIRHNKLIYVPFIETLKTSKELDLELIRVADITSL
ncbi:MAG: 6-phosphofructokinase [Flavobacteriaceae bacterium]|jgi:6-phosphofructokinase 1|nr:6-phosphofructokinase [Flavobacteriaceae bacterium]MBT3919951.1 6-phosphofructokinase [Flavobacteriaceae bacterium]MBT6706263.1 6-phosphofructokinase [Flavobacteriaceae bacterium]MBT7243053.1 6-phosphofructokinase [Flavobacteriaceae bacterium]